MASLDAKALAGVLGAPAESAAKPEYGVALLVAGALVVLVVLRQGLRGLIP